MNSGLVGGLGVQPLKSQRIFNTPYGSTIVFPVQGNNSRPDLIPASYNRHVDYGAFQVRDNTGQRALVLSHDSTSTGARILYLQSKTSPTGKIQWNGSDRSSAILFNSYISTDSYWSAEYFSSTTIGGLRYSARNGNGTLNHFQLWDDGQTTADVLALRNTTNAQAFRVYNTFTSLTNFERFNIDWQTSPNTCVLGTSAGGSGTVRGMEFRVGATTAMSILTSGTIQTGQTIETTAGTLVISKTATSTTGCFDMYANTSATGYPATNDKWFTWSATINGAKTEVLRYYARDATTYILGGANFGIQPAGIFPVAAGGNIDIATGTLRFSQAGNPYVDIAKAGTLDLTIAPTSNITRFGNNTSAQSLYVMNTYTSTANNERFAVDWITKPNTCVLGTSAGGSGTVRGMEFRVGATALMSMASAGNVVTVGSTAGGYLHFSTNTIVGGFGGSITGRPVLSMASGQGSSIIATVGGIVGTDCFGVSPEGGQANTNMLGVFSSNTSYTITIGAARKDFNGAYTGDGHNTAVIGGTASSVSTGGSGGNLILSGGAAAGSGNNNGGNVTITGGSATGTGSRGNVLITNLPTASTGLPTGALWNDAGTLKIV